MRINQAKATRAIKTKTQSEHMIHSHSSSTLSALKTAEENIKISMLSRCKIWLLYKIKDKCAAI